MVTKLHPDACLDYENHKFEYGVPREFHQKRYVVDDSIVTKRVISVITVIALFTATTLGSMAAGGDGLRFLGNLGDAISKAKSWQLKAASAGLGLASILVTVGSYKKYFTRSLNEYYKFEIIDETASVAKFKKVAADSIGKGKTHRYAWNKKEKAFESTHTGSGELFNPGNGKYEMQMNSQEKIIVISSVTKV